MPITLHHSKVLLPTLIILSLFLTACSTVSSPTTNPDSSPSPEAQGAQPSGSPVAVESQSTSEVTQEPIVTTDAAGAQVFEQTVSYNNPGGSDNVGFKITVASDGTITDASTQVLADPSHAISVRMQTNFAAALTEEVVGKKVSDLAVDRIGGASLTTGAFKKFLSQAQT